MKKIEKFATQLSKITNSMLYDYSFLDLKSLETVGTTDKELEQFFVDANIYVKLIIGSSEYLDKTFVLNFDSKENQKSAELILRSMSYDITDLSDVTESIFSLGVSLFNESANEFIFNSKLGESVISALTRTLNCDIRFNYDYNHLANTMNNGLATIKNTNIDVTINDVEIKNISDINDYNTEIIRLIDICPTYEMYLKKMIRFK